MSLPVSPICVETRPPCLVATAPHGCRQHRTSFAGPHHSQLARCTPCPGCHRQRMNARRRRIRGAVDVISLPWDAGTASTTPTTRMRHVSCQIGRYSGATHPHLVGFCGAVPDPFGCELHQQTASAVRMHQAASVAFFLRCLGVAAAPSADAASDEMWPYGARPRAAAFCLPHAACGPLDGSSSWRARAIATAARFSLILSCFSLEFDAPLFLSLFVRDCFEASQGKKGRRGAREPRGRAECVCW
jgi:hypothetical protein